MADKSHVEKLTPEEADMLAAFRAMDEKDRKFIRNTSWRCAHDRPNRPALRLINGGKATS